MLLWSVRSHGLSVIKVTHIFSRIDPGDMRRILMFASTMVYTATPSLCGHRTSNGGVPALNAIGTSTLREQIIAQAVRRPINLCTVTPVDSSPPWAAWSVCQKTLVSCRRAWVALARWL